MIVIRVYGLPGPQGSKRFVGQSKSGKGIMVESSKRVKPWREAVKAAGLAVMNGAQPLDGPLIVGMVFTLPKPKSAPKRRPTAPDKKPDVSKLARSTEDALSDAGVWADDARVVDYEALGKRYPNEGPQALHIPGALIWVRQMTESELETRAQKYEQELPW